MIFLYFLSLHIFSPFSFSSQTNENKDTQSRKKKCPHRQKLFFFFFFFFFLKLFVFVWSLHYGKRKKKDGKIFLGALPRFFCFANTPELVAHPSLILFRHQNNTTMDNNNPYKIEGKPPNFWINPEARKKMEWRDDDIVVSVPAKSGTTWTMNIVHQLREVRREGGKRRGEERGVRKWGRRWSGEMMILLCLGQQRVGQLGQCPSIKGGGGRKGGRRGGNKGGDSFSLLLFPFPFSCLPFPPFPLSPLPFFFSFHFIPHCSFLSLFQGGDPDFEDIYKEVKWIEFAMPYQSTDVSCCCCLLLLLCVVCCVLCCCCLLCCVLFVALWCCRCHAKIISHSLLFLLFFSLPPLSFLRKLSKKSKKCLIQKEGHSKPMVLLRLTSLLLNPKRSIHPPTPTHLHLHTSTPPHLPTLSSPRETKM